MGSLEAPIGEAVAYRPTQQIELLASVRAGKRLSSVEVPIEERKADAVAMREAMLSALPEWPLNWHLRTPPGHVYFRPELLEGMKQFQSIMKKALGNIIERWYKDEEANFSGRLLLEEEEDRILRWVDGPGSAFIPPWKERNGLSRPDFLLEEVIAEDGSTRDNFVVCEYNSRLPYNGFFISPYMHKALNSFEIGKIGLKSSLDTKNLWPKIMSFFDTSRPLYIINDMYAFLPDPILLRDHYQRTTGQTCRFVKPTDLRLRPDPSSKTGNSLWAVVDAEGPKPEETVEENGETLELLHQVTMSLDQVEYKKFSFEMLCQIAAISSLNDLRTVFLVNDQRLLGIVHDEIDNLVSKQKILTADEAEILRRGFVPSYLPTSPYYQKVLDTCATDTQYKDSWVLKATRGGFGRGHHFGRDLSNDEWLAKLRETQDCNADPNGSSYLLQRFIRQPTFDIVRHGIEEDERYQLVPSWHNINFEFYGVGPTRIASAEKVVSINEEKQGIVMMSVTDSGV